MICEIRSGIFEGNTLVLKERSLVNLIEIKNLDNLTFLLTNILNMDIQELEDEKKFTYNFHKKIDKYSLNIFSLFIKELCKNNIKIRNEEEFLRNFVKVFEKPFSQKNSEKLNDVFYSFYFSEESDSLYKTLCLLDCILSMRSKVSVRYRHFSFIKALAEIFIDTNINGKGRRFLTKCRGSTSVKELKEMWKLLPENDFVEEVNHAVTKGLIYEQFVEENKKKC